MFFKESLEQNRMTKRGLEEKIISLERRRGEKKIRAVKDFEMTQTEGKRI